MADGDNLDGSASTDKMLGFSWASVFGQFPGANEATLATITFDVAGGASGSTDLGISATSNAAGFSFDGQGYAVQLPASPLSIDSATGEVTLSVNPDYESHAENNDPVDYSLLMMILVAQAQLTSQLPTLMKCRPFDPAAITVTIPEDDTGVIYTAFADDSADISAGVTYSLSGDDASLFSDENSGEVTVAAGLDYETKTSYEFIVTADDGVTAVATQDVTVIVTNVDDTPQFLLPLQRLLLQKIVAPIK